MNHAWLILPWLLVFTVACAGSPSDDPSPHRAVEGSLVKNVNDLQKSEWAEECDRGVKAIQLELASALDAKEAEIQAFMRSLPPSDVYRRVTLGPTFVREVAPLTPKAGWQEHIESWQQTYQYYLKIKDQPTNKAWTYLNSDVRSLIVDDQDRLEGVNVYLDKDSGKSVELALTAASKCLQTESCLKVEFDPSISMFLYVNDYYAYYLRKIDQQTESAKKREFIQRFHKRLTSDSSRYRFRTNDTVKRGNGSELLLPLDAGRFTGVEEALQKYIEDIWKTDSLSVKMQWQKAAERPDIYKILLGDVAGERAWVDSRDRTVHLFPDVRTRSIAHEIGHVLGFRDHYYTVWHPRDCRYVVQYREDDLMSDPDAGVVTSDEWATLEQKYPATR